MEGLPLDIKLLELDILRELSELGSLRAVSRSRHLQPSHLSKIIRRLEEKTGTTLLNRSVKGVVLTPEGLHLSRVARSILLDAQDLKGLEEKRSKLITIGGTQFICEDFLGPAIPEFRKILPQYRFRVLSVSPDDVVPTAFRSVFDVIINVGKPVLTRAWHVTKIGDIRWGLFCGPAHPLAAVATEKEVMAYPFIVPNYWKVDKFEPGNDHCPISWRERKKGDQVSNLATAIKILSRDSEQLIFAPEIAMRHTKFREIKVNGWPDVGKSVYIAVLESSVSQKLYQSLSTVLKSILKG